jgi:Fe-S-cluster containining protein
MNDPLQPTIRGASDAELSSLCQSCGLCCDGSLFGRVDLETDEVEGALKNRLRVVGGGRSFEQPCSAFAAAAGQPGDRCGCSLYEHRPLSCRRFVCRLYERYRREGGPIEVPRSVVWHVRALLASLDTSADTTRARGELTRILEESFARA